MGIASVLVHVLGPVMRGPSSSHTAGSHHIARLARDLLGEPVAEAELAFDPSGSYAPCYAVQGSDRAFACGLLGWDLLDDRFFDVLDLAPGEGARIGFRVEPLAGTDHPNDVEIRLTGASGGGLSLRARSVGGGAVEILRLDGRSLRITGETWEVLFAPEGEGPAVAGGLAEAEGILAEAGPGVERIPASPSPEGGLPLLHARLPRSLSPGAEARLRELGRLRIARPLSYPLVGEAPFSSAEELIAFARERGASLGEAARLGEASLLGIGPEEADREMARRLRIMGESVRRGMSGDFRVGMRLLEPFARRLAKAERSGGLPFGGRGARAAAGAAAAMHAAGAMEVCCAAPTGGSAGVLPGFLHALEAEDPDEPRLLRALWAAGGIGAVFGSRATFAAEVAGCQVEIGAAGAMAAAGAVEWAGGGPEAACDAAATVLQNVMGSVCDPVQGCVEIPCHSRNAFLSAGAFLAADWILGGCPNPIPLDETIDAVLSVGRMLPSELRCTALGGLALCPSARAIRPRR